MEEALRNVAAAGSAAVIAVTGIHPIDVVKTRLQVSGDEATGAKNYKALGISGTVRTIAAEEGIPAFWKGIGAAWLREATYTSLRLGLYDPIKHAFNVQKDSPFIFKFASGSLAGAIGSIAGNPFDVLKTRMMASAAKGTPKLVPTATELYQQQGVKGFYRGIDANVMRAMVLNGTKMSCYDQIKSLIAQSGIVPAGLATQFVAAFGAGFFMACTVSPFDMVRTRLMNQPANVRLYNNFVDCFIKIIKKDGPLGLYNGFIPIWGRFAPTTVLQLVIFEQMKPIFHATKGGE